MAVAASLTLGACEDGKKFTVENRCPDAIEVDVNDVPDPVSLGYKLHWQEVAAGATASTGHATDPVPRMYVWVRKAGSLEVPSPFVFEPAELTSTANGSGAAVAVIEGDHCPSA